MNTPAASALLLVAAAATFTHGCGVFSAANDSGNARFFSIERAPPGPTAESPEASKASGAPASLRIGRVTGSPHLEERVVYRDLANEIGYHREVRWAEPPERFLERQLARALFEERGIRQVVGRAETTLVVKLTALDELRYGPHRARVQVVAKLQDEHLVLWEETLTVDRPVASEKGGDSAVATVEAMGEAMEVLVERIADRVARELEERRRAPPPRQPESPSVEGPSIEG
ncbi:MAG: membrane integrity-associated transporter subunit PqiC [Polyangiaceae bacterium]|nr:membrane integrity-associated transporter subunit PqiC [Polyangiaceae bacterium]